MNKVFNHKARKRFGQNFLHDANIIEHIIASIGANAQQYIVEIGPGQGALTEHLINTAGHLDVIELDRDLIPMLEERFSTYPHFTLYNADALQFDFATLTDSNAHKLRLVGNLPYNISTPLIFHLLDRVDIIEDMHFMLQKEVVDRLTACPNNKTYGRLSIMVQYLCHAQKLFIVPPGAFNPAPKVDSAIVQLRPRKIPESEQLADHAQLVDLSFIAKTAFAQRRKTLRNNLKKIISAEQISQCEIDPSRRAETLTISEFVTLTNFYAKLQKDRI